MRYFLLLFVIACALVVGVAGMRGQRSRKPPLEIFPDMDRQPKLRPQTKNAFFSDALSSRLPVAGTISRDSHYLDIPANTGQLTGSTNFVVVNPMPITPELIARGQQRFQINCLPCHGALADGNGVTRKFGMAVVANLHDPRIVSMTDGELFSVITHGRNLMGAYGPNVVPEDRWAIISYLRALQLARVGTIDDLSAAQKTALTK